MYRYAGQATDDGDALFPDWQTELPQERNRVLDCHDFIALPDKFEIQEYAVMEEFFCIEAGPIFGTHFRHPDG